MKKCYLTLLMIGLLFSCNSVYADVFTGEWRMFVNSDGTEIADNQLSIGLNISQAGTFYNVQVKLPIIPQRPNNTQNKDVWGNFLQASQDQYANINLQRIKEKFDGKYMLSDDGTTIEHLNGTVSFKYKQTGSMLYSKDLGCFKKGKDIVNVTSGSLKESSNENIGIGGNWKGIYTFRNKDYVFKASITMTGNTFKGNIEEFTNGIPNATIIDGLLQANKSLKFTKVYSVNNASNIYYSGEMIDDSSIQGVFTTSNNENGTFSMDHIQQ